MANFTVVVKSMKFLYHNKKFHKPPPLNKSWLVCYHKLLFKNSLKGQHNEKIIFSKKIRVDRSLN